MPLLMTISIFTLLDFILLFFIGSKIGLMLTLILVLGTGFIGLHLIRREGAITFSRARQRLEQGEMPAEEMLSGAALVFGGALLIAPGFLSDALGFMCLIPEGRRLLGKAFAAIGLSLRTITPNKTNRQQQDDWHPNDSNGWYTNSEPRSQGAPLEGEFIARSERRSR